MIPDSFTALLERLIEKTKKKQIIWAKTSRDNEFKVFLEKGAITTDNWYDPDIGDSAVDLAVYNERGDQIDRVSFFQAERKEYDDLVALHSLAKKSYFKVEETFEDILKQLNTDKTIGEDRKENDDLPF